MAKPGNLKFPSAVKSIVGSTPTRGTSRFEKTTNKKKNNGKENY